MEWTMSRYGLRSDGYYYAWCVGPEGGVGIGHLEFAISIRPVFYLKPEIEISGSGTIDDPFLIIT